MPGMNLLLDQGESNIETYTQKITKNTIGLCIIYNWSLSVTVCVCERV